MENLKKKRFLKKPIIITVSLLLIFVIGGIAVFGGAPAPESAPLLLTLERAQLTRTLRSSGVVHSENTEYIFSPQARPVQEIFVSVGDVVQVGDILAQLDMSVVENELSQTELSLTNARRSLVDETRANQSGVTNAQTALDSAAISLERQRLHTQNAEADWEDALRDYHDPFDSTHHDRMVADTATQVARRRIELNNALDDLHYAGENFHDFHQNQAIAEARIQWDRRRDDHQTALGDYNDAAADLYEAIHHFDDELFQRAVTEARIQLDRRQETLEEERAGLRRAEGTPAQRALRDAERNRDRRQEEYDTARNAYDNAAHRLNLAQGAEAVAAAMQTFRAADAQLDTARRLLDDARYMVDRARTDISRAEDNAQQAVDDAQRTYDRAVNDLNRARNDAVERYENALTRQRNQLETATRAFQDAERHYDRAVSDFLRAQEDGTALATHETRLRNAQQALEDAEEAHQRALRDRDRAAEDFTDNTENRLTAATRQFDDARQQLLAGQNSLRSAQNSLQQAQERPLAADIQVEMQTLNLERLQENLEQGRIVATASGVVTQINANVGATASGVLFIIEDVDNLYVAANVREHSLAELQLAQPAIVTTEVTGNRAFDAWLTFISPRAVSPVGSTSVEFEINVALVAPGLDIRIGMNAFIDVITDQRDDVFAVPLSALVTTPEGASIFVLDNPEDPTTRREVPVTTGLRTSTHMEIDGALQEGMVVLLRP